MANRKDLQLLFEKLLGSRNVYYQPPATVKMRYPAIVYSRDAIDNFCADDYVYRQANAYSVIVIDENPDSEFVKKVSRLTRCRFVTHYTKDNLNHDVFKLYY